MSGHYERQLLLQDPDNGCVNWDGARCLLVIGELQRCFNLNDAAVTLLASDVRSIMLHVKWHVCFKDQHRQAPFVTVGFPTTSAKMRTGSNEDNTRVFQVKWRGNVKLINMKYRTRLRQQFNNTLKYCALSKAIRLLRKKKKWAETAERLERLHYSETTFTRDASISEEQTFTVRNFQVRHLSIMVHE